MTFQLGPNQRAWIAALRSGRYRQGQFTLRRRDEEGDSFCCLGVAANITGCAWTPIGGFSCTPSENDELTATLGSKYVELYGLTLTGTERLAAANDSGASFAQIADDLERSPERFFSESR